MTKKEALARLESLRSDKMRAQRARALAIGEKLGVYRDYPTSPGCTSPFAPIWIGEIMRRQSAAA